MRDFTDEEIEDFTDKVNRCYHSITNGKMFVDTSSIRGLVKANKDIACRYVQLTNRATAADMDYLKKALVVAIVYDAEFHDQTLIRLVFQRAHDLGISAELTNM